MSVYKAKKGTLIKWGDTNVDGIANFSIFS